MAGVSLLCVYVFFGVLLMYGRLIIVVLTSVDDIIYGWVDDWSNFDHDVVATIFRMASATSTGFVAFR